MIQQGQLALVYDNPAPPPRRTGPRQPIFYVLPPRKISKRHVAQFLLLSILLHALVILLFGAPSGGSREGRAMWGSLQVDLRPPAADVAPKLKMDTTLAPVIPAPPVVPAPPRTQPLPPRQRTIQPYSFPPLLDRLITPNLKLERAPVVKVPLPTEVQAPPTPIPEPAAAPAMPAPPAPEPAPAPTLERAPVEPPPIAAPLPAPPPIIERAPVEAPALPVPPVQAIEPPRIESAPKPVEATPPPPQEIPVAPKPPTALERAIEREPPARIESAPLPKEEPAARPSLPAPPVPAVESIKRPVEPSTGYDPTAPSVDLDAVRKRAGQLAREGSGRRAVLPFPMPPVPEKKSKMETAIENARKPDCRTAYQGLGLAAVVPLIANEFGEGNCRW